ncbi:DUF1415 domain-containing protein [Hydrogenophilus thermoluteolus]|uniref:DUF1415 domain-containing protein n=1 Tax=Hydrogenophilus thermoluteolus TaxID=297 RepID=A0A2Z6DYF9_HYDTE|nr:DUF1415 domain-containing protein [Hydrogenophilus thermoluteolus]BBD77527.1 hypothetical protein HPTL_1263 [Hydrogenophilus thermoluteolus]
MEPTDSIDEAAVVEQMRAWIERAVIGLNLCPYAKAVWLNQQVRIRVSDARHIDHFLEHLDEELERLVTTDPKVLDTTLLVDPTLFPDFATFNDFLDLAEACLEDHDLVGVIQIASFHPQFQFAEEPEGDWSHYTNRAPYPTLHLLREASIAQAVADHPNPDAIWQRNVALMRELGRSGLAKLGIWPELEDEKK